MITISGTTQLTFTLPADVETAFAFYRDLDRLVSYLPRIKFVQAHGHDHLRLCYVSRELNAYDVQIFCDVQAEFDPDQYRISLQPQAADPPVAASSGFHSTTAYGRYASESIFYAEGEHTRLEYRIHLSAELPKPWALKLVPDSMMSAIATSISHMRINEIANGFIARSVRDLQAANRYRLAPPDSL